MADLCIVRDFECPHCGSMESNIKGFFENESDRSFTIYTKCCGQDVILTGLEAQAFQFRLIVEIKLSSNHSLQEIMDFFEHMNGKAKGPEFTAE